MRIATQRSIAIALAFVLSALVQQATAEAKCAGPQENWSLSDGERLPAKATLFYFAPTWYGGQDDQQEAPRVMARDLEVKSTWRQVSKNDAFTTYRLQFDATGTKAVVIKMADHSQRHPIGAWKAPKEKNLTGTIGQRQKDSWTCSHTDILPATVKSQAHAFKVTWFDVRNGVIDFGHGSSIFPRSSRQFWSYGDAPSSVTADFELGHPNCFAYNIPADNLNTIMVTVTPLFRDGSKGKSVTLKRGEPVTEEDDEEPVADTSVEPEPEPVEAVVEQVEEPTRLCGLANRNASAPKLKTRLFAIALLLGTLFGFLVFHGHRRGVPTLRLAATGSVVSIACGTLAYAATLVAFPFWLLFVAAGIFVILLAARFLKLDE
jgi:hypothetical protein